MQFPSEQSGPSYDAIPVGFLSGNSEQPLTLFPVGNAPTEPTFYSTRVRGGKCQFKVSGIFPVQWKFAITNMRITNLIDITNTLFRPQT